MLENQSNSQDVNLLQFIVSLWNGKWIVFFTILFFLLIAYIFFYLNNSFHGTIKIETISSNKHKEFTAYEFSQLQFISILEKNLIKYKTFFEGATEEQNKYTTLSDILLLKIGKKDLFKRFSEETYNIQNIKKIISKSSYYNKDEFENKSAYENAIHSLANSIIISDISKPKSDKLISEITFSFKKIEGIYNLFENIFLSINQEVQKQIMREFEILVFNHQKIVTDSLNNLNQREQELIKGYSLNIDTKIDFLQEQSRMAKKLGLRKNTMIGDEKGEILNLLRESTYYLRGYDVIDEEIKLIKNRTNIKSFIPGIYNIYQGIEYFENNKEIESLEKMLKMSPVYSNENFKSVFFDINKISISSKYNLYLLYSIAILFGFIAALIIIFVKDTIINIKR